MVLRSWPDNPHIPDLVYDFEAEAEAAFEDFGPPDQENVKERNTLMPRQQRLFRWAAESIAQPFSNLPQVSRLEAFGAVARPLEMEVPRFRGFRRRRLKVLHECADLDLAVWLAGLDRLRELRRALHRGLAFVQDTPYGGVAHHQVDVHVFRADTEGYCGRLCIFKECPKPGKRECQVPGCGAKPFLQQFEHYHFNPTQFAGEPRVLLFDRPSGFLVRSPQIDAQWKFENLPERADDDVPF